MGTETPQAAWSAPLVSNAGSRGMGSPSLADFAAKWPQVFNLR